MIEKYYKLDVMQFYRDFKGNQNLLKSQKEEKELSVYADGVDNDEPHASGQPGDPTAQRVFKRMSIDRRIRETEEYFTLEKNIREYLDEEEIMLADYLKAGKTVKQIAGLWHLSESQTRKKFDQFRRHVQEITAWQREKSGD